MSLSSNVVIQSDEALLGLHDIGTQGVEIRRLDRHAGLQPDVRRLVAVWEKPPAIRIEQLVDLDAGCGFFLGHSGYSFSDDGYAIFSTFAWIGRSRLISAAWGLFIACQRLQSCCKPNQKSADIPKT